MPRQAIGVWDTPGHPGLLADDEERFVSMIGEYARVTAEELDRALLDPEWAYDHVQDMVEDADETARRVDEHPAAGRMLAFEYLRPFG